MPYQEQIQKPRNRRSREYAIGTFPQSLIRSSGNGGEEDTDVLLERIEHELEVSTVRALGAASGVKVD